jgi:hypothetical protein
VQHAPSVNFHRKPSAQYLQRAKQTTISLTTHHNPATSRFVIHPSHSSKAYKDLTSFFNTIIMARQSLITTSGNHNKPLNPTSRTTLERARLLLDQMDQQLLEIHERSIAIRKAILIIKTKLLADARKRRDSETF